VTICSRRPASDREHYRRAPPDDPDFFAEMRQIFGRLEDEPLPDLTVFPAEILEFTSALRHLLRRFRACAHHGHDRGLGGAPKFRPPALPAELLHRRPTGRRVASSRPSVRTDRPPSADFRLAIQMPDGPLRDDDVAAARPGEGPSVSVRSVRDAGQNVRLSRPSSTAVRWRSAIRGVMMAVAPLRARDLGAANIAPDGPHPTGESA